MSRRVPEIFIVGTMKGGTSILYDYICTHPRVVPGVQKELHYFSMYLDKGMDWYLAQFPDRQENEMSIDASPTYFDTATMPAIPGFIHEAAPSARVIVIVRDPVERAVSHFQHVKQISHQEIFAEIEVNEFFSRPLECCYVRQEPSDWILSHVLDFSIYDDKFSNFARIFGRENLLVLTNEQLRTHPEHVMRQTFQHCRLEWEPSEIFGTQRYLSGSEKLHLAPEVRERLEKLFYPSFDRFLRRAGLPPRSLG